MIKWIMTIALLILGISNLSAQKVAFISTDEIRIRFPEAKQAEQRIQSYVEEWKRELEVMKINIKNLELEIKKNRLIWTNDEAKAKRIELGGTIKRRAVFASSHFEPGGEYDKTVIAIWKPIEAKIFAATSQVAATQGFDYVFDKSKMPIPYTNYKFDLTVKVLKKLGVNVAQLEKDLQKKIAADPRNKNAKKKSTRKRKRKSRYIKTPEEKGLEKDAEYKEKRKLEIEAEKENKEKKDKEFEKIESQSIGNKKKGS